MRLDDRACDRQSQACAAAASIPRGVGPVKAIENALQFVWRDSGPPVQDRELHGLPVGGHCDVDGIAGTGDAYRVPHQVAKHLVQPVGIGLERPG